MKYCNIFVIIVVFTIAPWPYKTSLSSNWLLLFQDIRFGALFLLLGDYHNN